MEYMLTHIIYALFPLILNMLYSHNSSLRCIYTHTYTYEFIYKSKTHICMCVNIYIVHVYVSVCVYIYKSIK